MYSISRRPRRNRKSSAIRAMVQETNVSINDFIYPLFLIEGSDKKEEIASMPGIYRYSLDLMLKEIKECVDFGIKGFCVFPSLGDDKKDKYATETLTKTSSEAAITASTVLPTGVSRNSVASEINGSISSSTSRKNPEHCLQSLKFHDR